MIPFPSFFFGRQHDVVLIIIFSLGVVNMIRHVVISTKKTTKKSKRKQRT